MHSNEIVNFELNVFGTLTDGRWIGGLYNLGCHMILNVARWWIAAY